MFGTQNKRQNFIMRKVKWGILSTANIGVEKVIPAMQKGIYSEVSAISSRDLQKAKEWADKLNIEKAYGSYEELLDDKDIEAIYIPLPNNMHLEWTIKALKAGKHVLCEKPAGMNADEVIEMHEFAKTMPHLKVMEAFMYKFHPQWKKVLRLIDEGKIGELKALHSHFSYHNINPDNIRNKVETGGGALMDIGCYCISFARLIFRDEPKVIKCSMQFDPDFGTDNLTSGLLEFKNGHSTFTCSTKLRPYQRAHILGTKGSIEIEIPVNAPDAPTRLWLNNNNLTEEIVIEPYDQYTLQGDYFSKAIIDDSKIIYDLEESIKNMKVIDYMFSIGKS